MNRRRTSLSLVLTMALLIALTACGGGDTSAGPTGSDDPALMSADEIPAASDALADGTPVMYEFYSDT